MANQDNSCLTTTSGVFTPTLAVLEESAKNYIECAYHFSLCAEMIGGASLRRASSEPMLRALLLDVENAHREFGKHRDLFPEELAGLFQALDSDLKKFRQLTPMPRVGEFGGNIVASCIDLASASISFLKAIKDFRERKPNVFHCEQIPHWSEVRDHMETRIAASEMRT